MAEALGGIQIRVASLLARPRNLPAVQAEEVYRAGESLALGLDIALVARGVRRTNLLAQRVNRVAFAERWAPPGGWAHFGAVLQAVEAGRPVPPPPGGGDPAADAARVLIGQGTHTTHFPHLLIHSGSPWFYVARDFPLPLWLPEPAPQSYAGTARDRALSVGSVPRLVRELEALAPALAEAGLDADHWFPAPLLEATAVSLETGLPIIIILESHGYDP